MASPLITGAQRAVGAALLFAAAAILAGVAPGPEGVRYAVFGAVEGMFALLLAAALVGRDVWRRPGGALEWLAVAYGTLATAQLLEFLLPPPGLLEWMVVTGLLFSSWGLLAIGSRRRLVQALAALAVLLCLVRYSVLPMLWSLGPERGSILGLGSVAESMRSAVAEPRPFGLAAQLLGVLAAALWALATHLLGSPPRDAEPD